MTVTKEKNGSVLNVAISGSLDINTAPMLKAELEGELDDVDEVYFDLKETDYTSSAGLRVLLSAQKTMNDRGSMKIVHVNETIMEIFEVTGFSDIPDIG